MSICLDTKNVSYRFLSSLLSCWTSSPRNERQKGYFMHLKRGRLHSLPHLRLVMQSWYSLTKALEKILEYNNAIKTRLQKSDWNFVHDGKVKRDVEQEYDPKRIPAWCDRILWLSLPGCHVDQLSYTSFPDLLVCFHALLLDSHHWLFFVAVITSL